MTLFQKTVQKILGREYDPISLIAVYSEILNKLYLLGFAYTLAYAQSVYLEWGKEDLINCYLSFVQLLISLFLVGISFWYRNTNGFISKLVRFSFFFLVLVEIETGFHDPIIPYFDPRNWLTIIALIGTTCFFYPGLVWQFILEWTVVFFLYVTRVAFNNEGSIPEETWREMSTTVPLFLVAFFLNHWWFQTRYIAAYRGMLLEEKRRTFFQDIHDSLGSKLTDLYLLSQNLEQNPTQVGSPQIQKIKELSSDALQSLRNQVKEEDHREILQESLVDGIHLLVKKRYKSLGRDISIVLDSLETDKLIQIKEPEHAHHILQILKEITTNDLRHGFGKTTCQVMVTGDNLTINFISEVPTNLQTKQSLEQNPKPSSLEFGLGIKGIEQRVIFLQGKVNFIDFPFQILIKLPKSIFSL